MELAGLVGVLVLGIIFLLFIKLIIESIEVVFLILLTMMVLAYFFHVSLGDVTAWISAQDWLQKIFHSLVNSLLYSLGK